MRRIFRYYILPSNSPVQNIVQKQQGNLPHFRNDGIGKLEIVFEVEAR